MPVDEKIPLMTFAEGLAYHYNNLFMGLIGHISIVMHHTQPSHQAYEGLRQCEELILNTASLIRLLVDVFHRSDCRQATLYPIDLSDHEISRLIFADHSVTVPVEKISQTEPCVQQILKTIAGRIATRLTGTLHDLEMQIRQVFVGNRLNAPYRHHIRRAMRYLKKGKRIAHNLLDFSGTVKFNAGRHDLLPIIKAAAEIYQTCFSHIGLQLDLAPNPIIVTCDRHLLRKAILDLIGICGDVDSTCNDLRISLNCVRSAAHDRRSRMRAPFVKLEFRHSSTQADVEYSQQAFDPFLSKSNKYINNLGPAAAMGIIRRHGGKIEYQPDGSMRTYNIYLPLTTVRRLSVI
jgi:K+-sensing histidine kinase KdpD